MKLLKQKTVLAFIAVLLASVIIGFHNISHKKSDSSSEVGHMLRYESDVYGISFEYPHDLHVLESEKGGNHAILITPFSEADRKLRSEIGITDSIEVIIQTQNQTFDEFVNSAKIGMAGNSRKFDEVVDGINAIRLSYISSFAGEEHDSIFIPCGESIPNAVKISYVAPLREEYSQIIKTINVCKKRPL